MSDTSAEVVDRLAARMDAYRIAIDGTEHNPGATLRALSSALENAVAEAHATGAERAHWKARAESLDATLKEAEGALQFCARGDLTTIRKGNRARAFLASLEGDKER